MRAVLIAVGVMLAAAAHPPIDPNVWLQERMDRIGSAAGLAPGAVRVTLVDKGAFTLDGGGRAVAVPRAVVGGAPSLQAVDGLLAMLLSYSRSGGPAERRVSLGELSAFAAILAATGGVSDGKDSKVIPLDFDQRASRRRDSRGEAFRGARWAEAVGGCTAALTAYLRVLARGPLTDETTITARRLLADMGMLTHPSAEPCHAVDDQGFAMVRARLSAPDRGRQ